jgi:hypothetical protein
MCPWRICKALCVAQECILDGRKLTLETNVSFKCDNRGEILVIFEA